MVIMKYLGMNSFYDVFSLARYTLPNLPCPSGLPISKSERDQTFLGVPSEVGEMSGIFRLLCSLSPPLDASDLAMCDVIEGCLMCAANVPDALILAGGGDDSSIFFLSLCACVVFFD